MYTENDVRAKVKAWARKNKIGHIRMSFRPGVQNGFPDDEFLIPGGVAVFIEFKRPGKIPTELQLQKIRDVGALGFAVGWFDNADAAIYALASIMGAVALHGEGSGSSRESLLGRLAVAAGRAENLDHAGGLFIPAGAQARILYARDSAQASVRERMAGGDREVDPV